MRPVSLLAAIVCLCGTAAFSADRRPVAIVELFTSEACSSCPSADAMLDRLQRNVPGVTVIALEEHIDYWNNAEWQDRFSAPIFHARQNDYAQFFRNDNIFTPQMVVNGHAPFVADNTDHVAAEVVQAAVTPQYGLWLQPQRNARDSSITDLTIYVTNNRQSKPEPADVYLAISETRLTSNVQRGENAGRNLKHGPVVRSFGVVGNIEARQFNSVGLRSTLKIPADWNQDHLRAVVFVQERKSRRITAAEVTELR
jgi:hypothetical protein